MLMILQRQCLDLSEAIEQLSEKHELLATLMEGKMSLQKVATEEFQRQIFQELQELEEQKTKEALVLLGWSRQGPKVFFPGPLTVPPLFLAHPPCHMTRRKQCPRPPESLPPGGRKETGGALTCKVKWRSWRSKDRFSRAEGGSMDPTGQL